MSQRDKDYEVGYGRPPKASRFRPGQSGNPRGRAKATKNLRTMLIETLERRVLVRENGRARRLTFKEVIIRGLVNDAAQQSPGAVKLLFALVGRQGDDGGEGVVDSAQQLAEDGEIIENFLRRTVMEAARNKPAPRRGRSHSRPNTKE
jgi:hypothetical protein